MRYIRVEWDHADLDDPITLLSELDAESWETRKVEVFRDGRLGFADACESSESTRLGLVPVPDLDEIAAAPEFQLTEITRDEFDRVWEQARAILRSM